MTKLSLRKEERKIVNISCDTEQVKDCKRINNKESCTTKKKNQCSIRVEGSKTEMNQEYDVNSTPKEGDLVTVFLDAKDEDDTITLKSFPYNLLIGLFTLGLFSLIISTIVLIKFRKNKTFQYLNGIQFESQSALNLTGMNSNTFRTEQKLKEHPARPRTGLHNPTVEHI